MGFGGGGGGALPAHVHNAIPLQGGPLDFANDTIASLNAGSTTFSDGAALQELVIGNVADTLVVNPAGNAPEWAAAATGSVGLSLIDHTVLGADAVDLDTSFAAVEQGTEMSGIFAVFNGARSNDTGFYLQVNGITAGASYWYAGIETQGGAASYTSAPNNGSWEPYNGGPSTSQDHYLFLMYFTAGDPTLDAAANQTLRFRNIAVMDDASTVDFCGINTTTGVTSINQIKMSAASGNILKGSSLSIYKMGV